MPKTKISEYSATANSNTDVASVNIDEGCAPSGINNAIRAIMGHLKDFQAGTNADPFNGPVNGTVGATTAATGKFTTIEGTDTTDASSTTAAAVKTAGGLAVAKKLYVGTGGAVVDGITVGKGAGAVATNTAVGASALAANSSGSSVTAVGSGAYSLGTASANDAFGANAMGLGIVTGTANVALGRNSLSALTSGTLNTAVGSSVMESNTTGSYNTAVGRQALTSNTTASNNTAVGYQAGYSSTTGGYNTFIGYAAGYSNTIGIAQTHVGRNAGYNATGDNNTLIGQGAGYYVTSGAKNTILGQYNGNQGGLDIRTASNYIVLSDGDGNPAAYYDTQYWNFGLGGTGSAGTGLRLNGSSASGYQPIIVGRGNGTTYWYAGTKGWIDNSISTAFEVQVGGTGGVYVASGGTSWTSASDERLKDIIEPITDAANKVSTLRAVIGKYKSDEEGVRRAFLIAQDVQAVLPEAVDSSTQVKDDETEYLGVSYTEVIPLLVAAIKELKAEIDILKGQA